MLALIFIIQGVGTPQEGRENISGELPDVCVEKKKKTYWKYE